MMKTSHVWIIVGIVVLAFFLITIHILIGEVHNARDEGYKEGYEAALYDYGIDE